MPRPKTRKTPQVSATLLGEPDLGLLTPPEMARKAGQIVYSIPGIPVLVDADTGGWGVHRGTECVGWLGDAQRGGGPGHRRPLVPATQS